MAGEMSSPVDRDEWPLHAAIADELEGDLRPFDVYQGPFVLVETKQGTAKLWVSPADEFPDILTVVYREPMGGDDGVKSETFDRHQDDACEQAVMMARSLLPE